MKRITKISISTMFLSVFALLGCSQSPEDQLEGGDRVAINVGAQINTKVVDNRWNDNDVIGITMFKNGTTDLAEGNFKNKQYTIRAGSTSKFEPLTDDNIIFFPKDGSQVDFMAYYPYNAAVANNYIMPIDVTDQTNLPNIDFMAADPAQGYSKASPNINLHFRHMLSKIIINLQLQSSEPSEINRLRGSKVRILGMYTKGTYNLIGVDPTVVVDANSGAALSFPTDITGSNAVGIVLPRPAGDGIVFEVELLDGGKYTGKMESTQVLASGFQYVFYLKIQKTHIDVSATVEPWKNGNDVNVNSLVITTPPNASVGIHTGDQMRLYNNNTQVATYNYGVDNTWTPANRIFWEDFTGANVSFNAAINPVAALNGSQLADYLVADPITVQRFSPINLTFRHAATKITVELSSSDNSFSPAELATATMTLPNYIIGGHETNGLFVAGTTRGNITLVSGVAIFDPQTVNGGDNVVIVTIGGKDYPAVAAVGGVQFNKGEARKLLVNVRKTGVTMSATVVDWITGGNVSLDGRFVSISTPGASSGFLAGSIIDLFVLNNNNASTKFTYQVNGSWSAATPLYWDSFVTLPINVAAVFPGSNQTPVSGQYTWNIEGNQQTGLATSDLMVAYSGSVAAGTAINLSFKHAMNKVAVVLKPGTGFVAGELDNAGVVIKNMFTRCSVNLTNLAISTLDNQIDIIPHKDSNLNYSAMVAPTTLGTGTRILEITIGGTVYPVSLAGSMSFDSGKINTLTVTVNKTMIGISCSVENWSIGNNGDYIIQ